ncbi:MAG TPA: gluconate 2-dehydrogenase subunit 3 family protein [Gemmatimonadales bacterium]|nr:gluconate 2-dehydrogenase subunit 3 family protein [Gemmatimonadales bacterium]
MTEDFRSRYPGYDVLDRWSSLDWDDQTREVVRRRLAEVPARRFFSERETLLLQAIVERLVPQPDRAEAERVPIVPWIDAKLADDRRDGYRYDGLPPQRELWRAALAGVDETAQALWGRPFTELGADEQDAVLRDLEGGHPPGATWKTLPSRRFFTDTLCALVVRIYYADPSAWSETGYNGPSSPRGHVRKWITGVDPWEAHERDTRWGTE